MKLVGAEYTFDNNKLLFYFTADGRIDFRELVKDLASVFRTRIELRQIGVRDETKMMGGVGICGRPLCCSTYLSDFVPVSIKMAKEQNLSLNPTKISGVCGRLMCCLKNEQDTYEYLNSRMPSVGDTVTAADGTRGEVSGINVLRQLVKVIVDNGEEKELREYPVDELHFQSRRRRDVKLTAEELKELEGLEDNESAEEKAEQKDNRDRRERGNRGNRRNNREDGGEQGSRRNNREDGSEQGSRRNNREDGGEQGNRRNNREDGGEQGNRRNNRRNRNNRNQRYDNNRGNQSNSQPENGAGE
jgi:hypothetical protein